jgi:hypothetical protein
MCHSWRQTFAICNDEDVENLANIFSHANKKWLHSKIQKHIMEENYLTNVQGNYTPYDYKI